jgi:hypothetical protein
MFVNKGQWSVQVSNVFIGPLSALSLDEALNALSVTRIIHSLYYAPAGRYINAWINSNV